MLEDFITYTTIGLKGVGMGFFCSCGIYLFLCTRPWGAEAQEWVSFVEGFHNVHDHWAQRGRGGFLLLTDKFVEERGSGRGSFFC